MGYRIRRVDDNQREIVAEFRKLGAKVQVLSEMGNGVPDILVGLFGKLFLVEIKNGLLSPSKQKLTPDEKRFHDEWFGYVHIVKNKTDVLNLYEKGMSK